MVHATIEESNRLSGEIAAATERWLKLGNKIEVVPITTWEGMLEKFNTTVNAEKTDLRQDRAKKRSPRKTRKQNADTKNFLMGRFFYELRQIMSVDDVCKTMVTLSDCSGFDGKFSGAVSPVARRIALYKDWRRSKGLPVTELKGYNMRKREEKKIIEEQKVAELFEQGLGYGEIGEQLGYARSWVHRLHNSYKQRVLNANIHKTEQ